ncbi:MAG: hypothetical protein UY08_C0001G0002 [Candidatus Gottesmanbacteria bacterium GW2011_GWA1_47_8]|uniref:N-acetyltransferase domain-containing protein n=1 Tax=Candidatus Gottesmanbacteria bacterium GW2011_GWA1_47_8 TaxID=1618438 RepID=A0A0G1TH73_9BACT|nr:MAG: hypothetical protein UY08_C0001G0002 [Candidatus Gottesmanbacteria bacterium GW2011_GWA1_47_8]
MMNNNQKSTIIFVSPRSYWDAMKSNLTDAGMRSIRYYAENFGLYGPGTIIAMMSRDSCIGAVYFVGPSVFERSIHIWSLFVDPRFRRKGLATRLMKIVVKATHGLADFISYQTKLASDSLPLYFQMGPNLLVNCHVDDTNGDWNNPKVVLEVKTPKRWGISTGKSMRTLSKDSFTIGVEDPFWKQVNTDSSMQRKYEIIGYARESSKSKVFLRSL